MPLTLREVLDLDAVRRGTPRVVAGAERLDVTVRWVHALELTDIRRLLRGGELVLSTGIALPESAAGLAEYVAALADVGIAGLAVELGRRYAAKLPDALVGAAQARCVPLIELRHEVPFIEITEAVHTRIIDELLVSRAAATLALGQVLTSRGESLERQAHRTLISAIIERSGVALDADEAEARARAMGVEVAGRELVAVVARLPDAGPYPAGEAGRVGAAGGSGGTGTAGATGPAGGHAAVLGVAEAMAASCRASGVPALVGALDDVRAGALLSLPPGGDDDGPLRALAARLAGPGGAVGLDRAAGAGLVIGASRPAESLGAVRAAFREAREVADVALRQPDGVGRRRYYRLPDLRLRGLLHLLRDDDRLGAFAGRELGPLLSYDAEHGTSLAADLAVFLDSGGNKALAASRAHLARPTFYQRLALIERILGVSLADPESRTSLHVALLTQQDGRLSVEAEFVAFRVGHDDPADIRRLVGRDDGAEAYQACQFRLLIVTVRTDVQVDPVLDPLLLLDRLEVQPGHAVRERHDDVLDVTRRGVALPRGAARDGRPEHGLRPGIGAVERDVVNGGVHGLLRFLRGRPPPQTSGADGGRGRMSRHRPHPLPWLAIVTSGRASHGASPRANGYWRLRSVPMDACGVRGRRGTA
ncbi:PucR family transcriptional regulator [Trebonia kvetii]|uniref:PucR family transcriptional regulator n=1 Tax=Trebonia kvetii TaxID=2480626 RepID=UPI003F6E364D